MNIYDVIPHLILKLKNKTCGARPRNNGLFPNSGPSEERHVQKENTYEALLNPNKRQGNLSEE